MRLRELALWWATAALSFSGSIPSATGSEPVATLPGPAASTAGAVADTDPEPAAPRAVRARPRPAPSIATAPPQRISIPAIDVDARVVPLALDGRGELEVPTDFAVAGWWGGGAMPGQDGPAVIVGHVDSHIGPAVFYRLPTLEPGDPIEVTSAAGTLTFTVERIERYPKDDFPTAAVYADTDGPTLRLITCGGAFDGASRHYLDNVVVFARLAR